MRIWGGSGTEIRKKGKRAGLRGDGVETEAGLSAEPDGEGAEGGRQKKWSRTDREKRHGEGGGETKRRPAEYRVPGRTAFLPTGPVVELGGRVWSCCARTCCRRRPGRGPPRSPWLKQPPGGGGGG